MAKIFKYKLALGTNKLLMPLEAEILTVQLQQNEPVLWARIWDDEEPVIETRVIEGVGTGWEFPAGGSSTEFHYIATVQQGPFVWHFFERRD